MRFDEKSAVYERAKIQMTNANKLKVEKRNIFWAMEPKLKHLLRLSHLYQKSQVTTTVPYKQSFNHGCIRIKVELCS